MLVDTRLDQFRIRQTAEFATGRDMVEKHLVGPACGSELAIIGNGHGIDRVHSHRQGLPLDQITGPGHFTGGTLVNPELDQAEFPGCQSLGADIIVVRGHERIALAARQQQ